MGQSKDKIRQNTLHGRLLQVLTKDLLLSFHLFLSLDQCNISIDEKKSSSVFFRFII
jgi:hypothetical protein